MGKSGFPKMCSRREIQFYKKRYSGPVTQTKRMGEDVRRKGEVHGIFDCMNEDIEVPNQITVHVSTTNYL